MLVEHAIIWTTTETPRSGCGRRHVIAKVGRKWVRLRPLAEPDSYPDKILKKVYDVIRQKDSPGEIPKETEGA